MIKVLRINQWSKNLLIFVVMFAANSINFTNVSILSILFFSFSLIVSSTYILNDLVDIQSDQNHPTKITIWMGVVVAIKEEEPTTKKNTLVVQDVVYSNIKY